MIKKDIIDDEGFNTYTLTEDMEFTGQCALKGEKIYYAEKAIYQGVDVEKNQDKIEKLMADVPFDKLIQLAMMIEDRTQHDVELKGYNFD